ncbi:hypothetical protein MHK_001187 [Candidatus Magnetomorum sp. HK-1]|nr:hypothetical protein MHK_001187 [Candidatus Magnetomorum sp. HK-1]
MNVISNSSPLIALSCLDQLTILEHMFKSVVIPDAVYRETVTLNRYEPQRTRIQVASETFIKVFKPNVHHLFTRNLGDGEKGVLNLGIEQQPDIVLLDDKKARNEAIALSLTPVFTTDVLKRAVKIGLLASYQDVTRELILHEIYLPESHSL